MKELINQYKELEAINPIQGGIIVALLEAGIVNIETYKAQETKKMVNTNLNEVEIDEQSIAVPVGKGNQYQTSDQDLRTKTVISSIASQVTDISNNRELEVLRSVILQRQERISDINEISKILCDYEGKVLDCSFKTEIDKIIASISQVYFEVARLFLFQENKLNHNSIKLEVISEKNPDNLKDEKQELLDLQLTQLYISNWLEKANLLIKTSKKSEGDVLARDYYTNNYFDFVSDSHNDELRHALPEENGSDVEPVKHAETLMKMAASILKKLGLNNNDISTIHDIGRFTIEVDDLFINLEKESKQKKIGQYLNTQILKINNSGKYKVTDLFVSRYGSGFASIKLHVKNTKNQRTTEIQINSKYTAEDKKLEEKEGLQDQRKQILREFKKLLNSTTLIDSDYNKHTLEDILFYYQDGIEETDTSDLKDELINKVQNIRNISSSETINQIDNLIHQYHNSLEKSESFFAAQSILQTEQDATNILAELSNEVQETVSIYKKIKVRKQRKILN